MRSARGGCARRCSPWSAATRWSGRPGQGMCESFVGRLARQKPGPVDAAPDVAALDQMLERGGHRRALAAHELAQQLVGEPQAQEMPAGVTCPQRSARNQNSTSRRVSTGESCSSAWWTDMRRAPAHPALEQRARDLRPLGESAGKRVVEHGQAHRLDHVPLHMVADELLLARVRADGGEHVALAQQLGAGLASEDERRARAAPRGRGSRAAACSPSSSGTSQMPSSKVRSRVPPTPARARRCSPPGRAVQALGPLRAHGQRCRCPRAPPSGVPLLKMRTRPTRASAVESQR